MLHLVHRQRLVLPFLKHYTVGIGPNRKSENSYADFEGVLNS